MKPVVKGLLIGCGAVAFLVVAALVGFMVWLVSIPESGVKLGNEMDAYATEYLAEHDMLRPGEEVLAYYDVTMSMDGTEAAILTSDRVLYHKNERTAAIEIDDIADVRHRYEGLVGDVIEVESDSGTVMKIEIAPWNQGETFKNVLVNRWERASAAAPANEGS
jgi:hypothetical protein